jgi:mRNA interferase RelE/StbE
MAYRIVLRASARRELAKLPQPIRGRVTRSISALAMQPRPPGAKLLSGPERSWRVRVGDYRILVVVVRIRHRRDVYR